MADSNILPETYHWHSQLHETSPDHLYILTNGSEVKIGRAKNPSKQFQQNTSTVLLAVIKNKGFLEKTLHGCFSDIRMNGGWFKNTPRIANFLALTQNWHIA